MYTKGEWTVELYDNYTNVEAKSQTICTNVSNCDANLIASSPALYEALKELVRYHESLKSAIPCLVDALEALAKAEGK